MFLSLEGIIGPRVGYVGGFPSIGAGCLESHRLEAIGVVMGGGGRGVVFPGKAVLQGGRGGVVVSYGRIVLCPSGPGAPPSGLVMGMAWVLRAVFLGY